jgi:hypothetical protein
MKSTRFFLGIYLLLLSAHVALIWILPYIPTQDGPSHIYNLAILRDLLHGGEIWGAYYTHKLQLSPNLGFQIFAYPLLSFLDPWQTEKAFLSIYIFFMGLSVPVFLKTFDRPVFPVSFLVFPVIFNFTLLMGFYSYCIAIPFFLLTFSLAWVIRKKPFCWKILTYNICGFFLFCLHLVPFVFFILALFCISISEYFKKDRDIRIIFQNLAAVAPLIFLLFYYLLTQSQGISFSFEYIISLKRVALLFTDLVSFSTFNYSMTHFIPSALFSAMVWALIIIGIKANFSYKKFGQIFQSPYFMTALALFLIYFIFPFGFAGGSFFNQRFPWVILLLLLPLIKFPVSDILGKSKSIIIICFAILIFMFNSAFMWKHSFLVEDYTIGLTVPIPKDSLIMGFKHAGINTSRADVLLHAISHYALVHKTVNVGNYEARLDYFPVQFSEDFPAVPPRALIEVSPWKIDWNRYADIDFLVAWEMTKDERKKIEKFFGLTFEKGNLSIWHRNQNTLDINFQ